MLIVCCGSKACSLGNYSNGQDHRQYIKDHKQAMAFKDKLLSYMAGPPQITLLYKFYSIRVESSNWTNKLIKAVLSLEMISSLGKILNLKLPWMHHSVSVCEGSIGKIEVLSWSREALYKFQSIYQG